MKQRVRRVTGWFEHRLRLAETVKPILEHPAPSGLGWWYVFGSATMTLFVLQIVTGICLSTVYVPSAGQAYESLQYLNYHQTLGWYLRAVHYWGSSAMIVMLALHMTRVFIMGAFKYPRELTWVVGVVLLLTTLGLAFSGQVLRWDQDAYWGVGVGAAMMGRIPYIGPAIVHALLGGATIGGETLSRFLSLHVFILPGLLGGFLAIHLYLVVKQGISERPRADEPVDPRTYEESYRAKLAVGEPFFPSSALRDLVFASLTVAVVLLLAAVCGPKGPGMPADPTIVPAEPRPDWPFMPLFALLALSPPAFETVLMLGLPVVVIAGLFLIPFLFGRGVRSPRQRPLGVLSVLLIYVIFGVLWWYGETSPWSPRMFAWSADPVPEGIVKKLTPLELQGAVVFQNKTCRNCHSLEGKGGKRGPDLTYVGVRLDVPHLTRQVIQGGGLMPAYGKQLDPAEVKALVAFLHELRPPEEAPPNEKDTSR